MADYKEKTWYTVSQVARPYVVWADKGSSLEKIWNSEKCWFGKGQHVLITDESGKTQEFVKE